MTYISIVSHLPVILAHVGDMLPSSYNCLTISVGFSSSSSIFKHRESTRVWKLIPGKIQKSYGTPIYLNIPSKSLRRRVNKWYYTINYHTFMSWGSWDSGNLVKFTASIGRVRNGLWKDNVHSFVNMLLTKWKLKHRWIFGMFWKLEAKTNTRSVIQGQYQHSCFISS